MGQCMTILVNHFHELTRSWQEAVFLVSGDGKIIAVNPAGSRMLGLSNQILSEQEITDIVTDSTDKVSRYLQVCSRNRDPIPGAFAWRRNDGQIVECRCNGSVIRPGSRRSSALILLHCEPVVSEDNKFFTLNRTLEKLQASYHELKTQAELLKSEITERKRVEDELKDRGKFLNNILDSIQDGISILDKDMNILQVNRTMEQWYTHKVPLLGKKCYEAYHGRTEPCKVCPSIRTLKSEKKDFEIVPLTGSEGVNGWLELYTYPLVHTRTGKLSGVIEYVRDITERKLAEEKLREYAVNLENMVRERTRKLEEAQEARIRAERLAVIGKLSSVVGHELRNPIGAIGNSVYFLKMVMKDSPEKVKKHLNMLDEQVKLSSEIINEMLEFARGNEPVKGDVELNRLIEESLFRIAKPGNVEIRLKLDSSQSLIKGDKMQLTRVFENLIQNAFQAMPGGGMLSITTVVNPEDGSVEAVFEDTGEGISVENLDRVFEPLFSTKIKGIGLGLSICRMFVEKHGGRINVRSEEGKGAAFTVKLPMKT